MRRDYYFSTSQLYSTISMSVAVAVGNAVLSTCRSSTPVMLFTVIELGPVIFSQITNQ